MGRLLLFVGVMKMGNNAYNVRIEPTSHAFGASVLTITPPRLPDVTTLFIPTCLCDSLSERSVHAPPVIVSLLMLTSIYIQTVTLYSHKGRSTDHEAPSLFEIMDTAASVMTVRKMGNTVPNGRI